MLARPAPLRLRYDFTQAAFQHHDLGARPARGENLRREVSAALIEICDPADPPLTEDIASATASIIAVMDGLQIQWLLAPGEIRLAESSAFAIDAILAAAVHGHRRRVL